MYFFYITLLRNGLLKNNDNSNTMTLTLAVPGSFLHHTCNIWFHKIIFLLLGQSLDEIWRRTSWSWIRVIRTGIRPLVIPNPKNAISRYNSSCSIDSTSYFLSSALSSWTKSKNTLKKQAKKKSNIISISFRDSPTGYTKSWKQYTKIELDELYRMHTFVARFL